MGGAPVTSAFMSDVNEHSIARIPLFIGNDAQCALIALLHTWIITFVQLHYKCHHISFIHVFASSYYYLIITFLI